MKCLVIKKKVVYLQQYRGKLPDYVTNKLKNSNNMKRFLLLFALIALCTTGTISAQGWGEATCILPDKSQRTIKFYYDMASSSLKRVRIVCSDGDGKKSCVNTNYNKEVIDKVGPHFEGCEIIFPSTFGSYTITAVGHSAFYECKA